MNTKAKLDKSDIQFIKDCLKDNNKDDIKNLCERILDFSNKIETWKEGDEIDIPEQEQYKNDMEKLEHIIRNYEFLLSMTVFDKKLTKAEKLAWLQNLKNDVDSKFNLAED